MSTKRFISILILIALCISLLGACAPKDEDREKDKGEDIEYFENGEQKDGFKLRTSDEEEFDKLIDELFAEWVSEDTITMNYFLKDPEAMGIERPEPSYGAVMTPELFLEEKERTLEIAEILDSIEFDMLSDNRQVIYEIIYRITKISMILEEDEEYNYYTGYIRPITGIQVQLPILLTEFVFYTAEDIERYLALLADTVRYFNEIAEFESERAARGYFLSDDNLDTVIEQLRDFSSDREDNFLITVVNDKIDAFPGLTNEQREQYKQENRELVLGNVLVAYDNLIAAMTSLKGVGAAPGGLASLPNGERYAHASLSLRAGTDRSSADLVDMVSQWKSTVLFNVRSILTSDDDIMRKYSRNETGQIPDGTSEEYLGILQNAMLQDFPQTAAIDFSVQEIHESLREHMSPAFYVLPAADYFDENVIYINPSSFGDDPGDNLTIFTVLAHEGYPGHMYQTVYSRRQSLHPIRIMLSNTGYSEGWATYVEYISYSYAGLDELEAEFMREITKYFLLLQSHIDLGVNLLDWGVEDVASLLYEDLGITDEEAVASYFNSVTGRPLNTSLYALGYIEMSLIREEAESTLGSSFDPIEFHRFILDFGPAPFSLIRQHMR